MHGRGPPVKLPTLSIAARLYAIFALMAATTVALSVYAVSNARFHAALTEEFESANAGSWNVERINGHSMPRAMESRGIYMSPIASKPPNMPTSLLKVTDQISDVMATGSAAFATATRSCSAICRPD